MRLIGGHLVIGGTALLQLDDLAQADDLIDLARHLRTRFGEHRELDEGVLVRLQRG